MEPLVREVLIALWKIHILHHAAERPVWGQWITEELRRHGYRISPGTLYPLLRRMETRGWLSPQASRAAGSKARRSYSLTAEGTRVLAALRTQVAELHRELTEEQGERQGQVHSGRELSRAGRILLAAPRPNLAAGKSRVASRRRLPAKKEVVK